MRERDAAKSVRGAETRLKHLSKGSTAQMLDDLKVRYRNFTAALVWVTSSK
jgi:hypothetical protein